MTRSTAAGIVVSWFLVATLGAAPMVSATAAAAYPDSLRLYVLDCGSYPIANIARFSLTRQEIATDKLSIACFLVAHPKGALVWDTGSVPDKAWTPANGPVIHHVVLPDGQERDVTLNKPLLAQLAGIGYPPEKVTYLALSHYHFDHTANANEFSAATWLVTKVERDAMFAAKPPPVTIPSTYAQLMTMKTIMIAGDCDVFGDGSVIVKPAPGHTPGHQVLYLKLAQTGGVVLSGDLYHFPESRTLQRVPTFDFDPEQSLASRAAIEGFLRSAGAQLWIQHDFLGNAKLRKAPEYYD